MFWFLAGVVVVGFWLIRAWQMPFAPCRRCGGRKVNALTRFIGGDRSGACGSCGGSGQRMVLSARLVRHAVRGLRSANGKRKG